VAYVFFTLYNDDINLINERRNRSMQCQETMREINVVVNEKKIGSTVWYDNEDELDQLIKIKKQFKIGPIKRAELLDGGYDLYIETA
jgi:hypothetical protein